jgi:hypothetical protein
MQAFSWNLSSAAAHLMHLGRTSLFSLSLCLTSHQNNRNKEKTNNTFFPYQLYSSFLVAPEIVNNYEKR